MMRITRVPGTDGVARLSIEGRLAEAEVTELATSCEAYLAARHPLLLDLSGVTFVDAQALGLLHAVAQRGAVLTGCSPFLREMLGSPQGEAE
jgi:anti-anti-sigma regulatory factor